MTIANSALLLTVPDYSNIRGSFVGFLKNQKQFADYNFEGSNISVIIDLLAYNTYQNAFLTNMVATEMFLDTALLPSSVISRAKELGYTPRSVTSSSATLNVQIFPNDNPGVITIPSGTPFSTSIGNQSFNFYTESSYVISQSNGIYIAPAVNVYEGFPIQDVFTVNTFSTNQTFNLSNANVDINTVQVYVTENGPEAEYIYTSTIVGLTSTSNSFFIQQDFSGNYQIEFGDGVTGYNPGPMAAIRVTYKACAADAPNGANNFVNSTTIAGYSNVVVSVVTASLGGAPAESISSIKYYAPLKSQTLNRAVVETDYEILLRDQFPEITAIHAFGGQDMNPPQYGQVVIVVALAGITNGLPAIKVNQYTNFIKAKNLTLITPIFIAPTYISIRLNSTVYYDYTQTSLSSSDVEAAVLSAIQNYNKANLSDFDTVLRYSKLGTAIDNALPAINSNDTTLTMSSALNTT